MPTYQCGNPLYRRYNETPIPLCVRRDGCPSSGAHFFLRRGIVLATFWAVIHFKGLIQLNAIVHGKNKQCDTRKMLHALDNFLTPRACDELVARYDAAQTEPSRTVDGMRRTSHFVYVQHDDAALDPVWDSIPPLFEPSTCERAQITRYDVGGSFGVHSDAFTAEYLCKTGTTQRCGTFLIYLNDVKGGGETHFPRMETRVTPRKGHALWFRPSKYGLIDDQLIHAALPVTKGVKYILQIWCRERGNLTEKK